MTDMPKYRISRDPLNWVIGRRKQKKTGEYYYKPYKFFPILEQAVDMLVDLWASDNLQDNTEPYLDTEAILRAVEEARESVRQAVVDAREDIKSSLEKALR